MLYEILVKQNLTVSREQKLLKHHYSHLVITDRDGKKYAVEIIKKNFTVNAAQRLIKQYEEVQASVVWIELDDIEQMVIEKYTNFADRFLLNEYAKTLVIIDKDLTRMAEYKMASAEGTSGREYLLNSEELYCETSIVRNLVFENGIITISKFETRFQQWMKHRIQQAERQREEYMKMKSEKERKEQERRKLAEEKNRIQLLEQEKKN